MLIALTAGLFDRVPLEKMPDAEHALREEVAQIPAEVSARFETAERLSDEDRKAVIEIARKALEPFQAKPDAKPESQPKTQPEVKLKAASKPETPPKAKS
jgi:F-type H+-transporting ATPase subunit alpha